VIPVLATAGHADPVSFDVAAAVVAGVLAAQPMELPVYVAKALGFGVRQDVFAEAGAMLRAPRARRFAGWVAHGLTAALIALLYAAFFDLVDARTRLPLWGLAGGALHFAVAGFVVGAFPVAHPEMPCRVPAPGVFYRRYGVLDVVLFLGGHLLFGGLLGALYGALRTSG
jgi:hypothetical protein